MKRWYLKSLAFDRLTKNSPNKQKKGKKGKGTLFIFLQFKAVSLWGRVEELQGCKSSPLLLRISGKLRACRFFNQFAWKVNWRFVTYGEVTRFNSKIKASWSVSWLTAPCTVYSFHEVKYKCLITTTFSFEIYFSENSLLSTSCLG